mgnify:CR=1 FL=1
MPYCSVQDVRNRNNDLLKPGSVDDDRITGFISYSEGIVNGMLAERYPVPLSTVPELIRGITADMAASKALAESVGNAGTNEAPTQADNLWKQAMDLLKMLADGTMLLAAPIQAETTVKVPAVSSTYGRKLKFEGWDPSNPMTYRR